MTTSLRLLSLDARPFGRDRAGLARTISAAGCDVVCVHGGPRLARWRAISATLARRTGLVVVTGGRPAGANLLLSTLGVDVVAVRDLRFAAASPLESAGAALAALRQRGVEFVLASATFAGNAAQRLEQARQLQDAIERLVPGDVPAIISADGADTTAWQAMAENRAAVADRLLADDRIVVGEVTEQDHVIRAELSV